MAEILRRGDIVTAPSGGVRWTVTDTFRGADRIPRVSIRSPRGTSRQGVPEARLRLVERPDL